MKKLIIVVITFLAITSYGDDLVNWSRGSVVEKDGQVRIGEVSFRSVDLILFRADGKVMVYTPYHVKAFFYYDEEANVNRKFNTLQIGKEQSPLFYEYVVWGKVQMVRLAKNRNLIKGKLRDTFDYDYLIAWNDNYIRFKNFKREVFPLLIEESPILEELAHNQKLNPSSIVDAMTILKLYNRVNHIDVVARND